MAYQFSMQRMVEFAETDMAGIMHFANYFRFMEAAEHAFFRSLGLSVHEHDDTRMAGWARIRAECSFAKPLRYQDIAHVELVVAAKTDKSLTYHFTIRRADPECTADAMAATGAMTVVYITRSGSGAMRSHPMPAEVAEKIEVAPPELLQTT